MLTLLAEVLHGLLDLPYLLLNLVVESFNGWILILASFLELIMSALPSFPELPHLAGSGVALVAWFLPLSSMVAVFGVFLVAWVIWNGYVLIAKKIGLL